MFMPMIKEPGAHDICAMIDDITIRIYNSNHNGRVSK